jgi:nucleoside transporter
MMNQGQSPTVINVVFFIHMLCYFPTLALTNTLAMHNLSDTEKMFPLVRVGGTIGWIAAGVLLAYGPSLMGSDREWAKSIDMFYITAGAALLLGVYSFTLPHTPPPAKDQPFSAKEAMGLNAIALLTRPSFLVFIVSSLLICIPLAFYYQMAARALEQTGATAFSFKMSFGQWSEIIFMVAMPLFFARLGVKWMLLVGMAAWVARYALFAVGAPAQLEWMILIGVVLHGICYDFFFVTGQIYTDKVAPSAMRGQAQGFLVLCTLGIGMLVGAQIGGKVEAYYTPKASTDLTSEVADISAEIKTITGDTAADKSRIAELEKEVTDKTMESLRLKDWRMIWGIPCIFAGVIMIIFLLFFRDDSKDYDEPEGKAAAPDEPKPALSSAADG